MTKLSEFIKFHWCFVNYSKYRSTKKFLFSVVYFHTSSPKKQKFSDRSFLCFNLHWFKQLLFEINFNPAYRHSWDLLHVEGKLSFVMERIWVRLHGFCNKTLSFPSVHLLFRKETPSSSPQRIHTFPKWLFLWLEFELCHTTSVKSTGGLWISKSRIALLSLQ